MMTQNVKRLASVVAGALMVLGVTACGGGSDAEQSGSLSISNWQWIVPDRGERLWNGVTQYTKANPDASLEKVSTPFPKYADKLNTQLGAGEGPDVFVVLESQFVPLAEAGLLEPLDDELEDANLNASNDAAEFDGEQLGITWERVNYALTWNKDLLKQAGVQQPPETVPELIDAAQAVQQKTDARGFGVRHSMNDFEGFSIDFTNWVYGFAGAWATDGGDLTLDSAENVEAVTAFKEVYDAGIMPIGDDMYTMRKKFQQGRIAMIIENGGGALVNATAGKLDGKTMGAAPMPFPEAGTHQQLILAVNANSDNKEMAKDFVAWIASEEGQKALRPGIGVNTMATDVALPPEMLAQHPWAKAYPPLAANSRSPLVTGHEEETKEIKRHFMEAVEDVLVNDADPQEALAQAQEEAQG